MPAKARKEEEIVRRLFLIVIIPFVFFLDRLLKNLILANYPAGGGFVVVPGVFHITRVNNTGAAFGMLKGYGTILIVISSLFVVFLLLCLLRSVFSAKAPSKFLSETAWSLIIAGAAGNLFDRARYGYVVDFLDFRIWPVFNLADASICLGVFLVALGLSRTKKN